MLETKFYVYIYLNPLDNNQPFYIGKGCGNRHKIHLTHCREKYTNLDKYNLIQTIRQETNKNPPIIMYATDLFEDEAFYLEEELIAFYGRKLNSTGILYNLTEGGRDCFPLQKGNPKTNFQKQKISKANKGKISVVDKNGFGLKVSKDDPRWLSGELVGVKKGIKESKETRKKKSIAKQGIIPPKQFKSGDIPWNKGISHSLETLEKIKHSNDSRIYKKSTCIKCGLKALKSNITRWHNNNCKYQCA